MLVFVFEKGERVEKNACRWAYTRVVQTCTSDYRSSGVCLDYLWEDTQEPDGFSCLWEEGWELLFTVYLLYLLNFIP